MSAQNSGAKDTKAKKNNATIAEIFQTGVELQIQALDFHWQLLPSLNQSVYLIGDLKRIFKEEVPLSTNMNTFYATKHKKDGTSNVIEPLVPPPTTIVSDCTHFLEEITRAVPFVASTPPDHLMKRLSALANSLLKPGTYTFNSESVYDIFELLSIFSDLAQFLTDSVARDIIWAIVAVGVASLHKGITTTANISAWPSKLRNAFAHAHFKLRGPVVVGFSVVPPNPPNKSYVDWHICIEIHELAACLAVMSKQIATAVNQYKSKEWHSIITLSNWKKSPSTVQAATKSPVAPRAAPLEPSAVAHPVPIAPPAPSGDVKEPEVAEY
jgi:hypothetical protein